MAGASAIGIASSAHLNSFKRFDRILAGLEKYMKESGYNRLDDFRGKTQQLVMERQSKGWHMILEGKPPIINVEKCTACNRCVEACVYDALSLVNRGPNIPGKSAKMVQLESEKCIGCGLCYTRCLVDAIATPYFIE